MKIDRRPDATPAVPRARDGLAVAESDLVERFAHVDVWVFDLDNTLYPSDSDLWLKIDDRITLFLAHLFGLDAMSSRALQKFYYQRYGTTLNGLMQEHEISAEQSLDNLATPRKLGEKAIGRKGDMQEKTDVSLGERMSNECWKQHELVIMDPNSAVASAQSEDNLQERSIDLLIRQPDPCDILKRRC